MINGGHENSPKPRHTKPLIVEDGFDGAEAPNWKDHGSETKIDNGRLTGGKRMATTFEEFNEANALVSVDARSDAEAGIMLRFQDPDNYVVALYTPELKQIYIHDRRNGQYGEPLGAVPISKVGENIKLTAAVSGPHSALVLSDGESEYRTPVVSINNTKRGRVGVWLYQVGERQQYDNFALSRTLFMDPDAPSRSKEPLQAPGGNFTTPPIPTPQDWVLVMERATTDEKGTP